VKNSISAAYAALIVCLLSCVTGCASTHFDRKEVHSPTTDVVKQCSSDRYKDTDCVEYVETANEYGVNGMGAGVYGAGIGYDNGLYPTGMNPPAVRPLQGVHMEPMSVYTPAERYAEGTPGGTAHYEPVATQQPSSGFATKEQLTAVARKVKQLDDEAKKKSAKRGKNGETSSEKESK
jgi:hypothetical protein